MTNATSTEPTLTGSAQRLLPAFPVDLAAHMERRHGWGRDTANARVYALRLYLSACRESRIALGPPSKEIDEVWHAFVLFTKEYGDYCNREAGRMLHHIPDVIVAAGSVKLTIDAMRAIDPSWRPESELVSDQDCCCAGPPECTTSGSS